MHILIFHTAWNYCAADKLKREYYGHLNVGSFKKNNTPTRKLKITKPKRFCADQLMKCKIKIDENLNEEKQLYE